MKLLNKSSVDYKLLSFDELVISLDRLSRFKLPEESFIRVFSSVIFKNLISPKYSKADIDNLDPQYISDIVKEIWNNSVDKYCKSKNNSKIALITLRNTIKNTFKNIDERTNIFINTNLKIAPILEQIDYETAAINLKFLKIINEHVNDDFNLHELREKYSLCFPVTKLLIVEGITEEILLPVFADKLGENFNSNGIYIMGAGGKSKSPALYMQLKEKLKIPVVLLFDEDAKEICDNLNNNLLKKDKYIIIENGEFEDILPLNLIKRTINNEYLPATPVILDDLRIYPKMCENIENIYRIRHLGEFKKSKFAKIIAQNIKYDTDISEEIKKIIYNLR